MNIRYKKRRGWKYKLWVDTSYATGIIPIRPIDHEYLAIDAVGYLRVRQGYCWDGPSGPTVDTKTFMRGSLIHDALYQLMREGVVAAVYRKRSDIILRDICLEDGMSKIRAGWVYHGVRVGANKSSRPNLLSAP